MNSRRLMPSMVPSGFPIVHLERDEFVVAIRAWLGIDGDLASGAGYHHQSAPPSCLGDRHTRDLDAAAPYVLDAHNGGKPDWD